MTVSLSLSLRSSSLDDLRGADALLCLANIVGETQPLDVIKDSSPELQKGSLTAGPATGKVF